MGMYTEFFFRAQLAKDAPAEVVDYLQHALTDRNWATLTAFDDHEFFQCRRWDTLLLGGSSLEFPTAGYSKFLADEGYSGNRIIIHASLKNYDGEALKFVDWISPYLSAAPGDFLGYTLYEDTKCNYDDQESSLMIFMGGDE